MRRDDWPEQLFATLDRHSELPFGWGTSDCYLLVADALLAMTGEEPWPDVRGAYTTEEGAARQLRRHGFADLVGAFASVFPDVLPSQAQRGDIGVVRVPYGAGFAGVVVIGAGAVGKNRDAPGNINVPIAALHRTFRVT